MSEQQTPTPIDPADIRPGDVVRVVREITVRSVIVSDFAPKGLLVTDVKANSYTSVGATFHLVHRPDPDAEAVEALAKASRPFIRLQDSARAVSGEMLERIREAGWDVTRRQP